MNMDSLPQPREGHSYDYIRSEKLVERFCGRPLQHDELVWVLKSKGKRKSRAHDGRAGTAAQTAPGAAVDNLGLKSDDFDERATKEASATSQRTPAHKPASGYEDVTHLQRLELFLRAHIQGDPVPNIAFLETNTRPHRVKVRYSQGSTYTVAADHIVRVLDKQYSRLVLVFPETPLYRRACVVHTLPDEVFLEIGSGLGLNVDRVSRMSTARVMGADKSRQCIASAGQKYPQLELFHWDILEAPDQVPEQLKGVIVDVLAIDINGSRELEAVLDCLLIALGLWSPRLVIVKARSLHQLLVERDTQLVVP